MSMLLAWVLAASQLLAPGRDHEKLAEAIVSQVSAEPPLFAKDADHQRTAALLVAIAFRESSLRPAAVGDMVKGKPTSFCAFQIHLPYASKTAEGWTGQDLIDDPAKCVASALHMLRISMRVCPAHPIAWYAEGPGGCKSPRAQTISRDRLAIAKRLVAEVPLAPEAREATDARDATDAIRGRGLTMFWTSRRRDAAGTIE